MVSTTKVQFKVRGAAVGARGCAAACSCDPCDCDPCGCMEDEQAGPRYPQWRVSGSYVAQGHYHDIDLTGLLLLSVTQPSQEGRYDVWQEVLLVDQQTTDEQLAALLALFEDQLDSMPAEAGAHVVQQRAIYRATIGYSQKESASEVHIAFHPSKEMLVRAGEDGLAPGHRAWIYDGSIALRNLFEVQSEY